MENSFNDVKKKREAAEALQKKIEEDNRLSKEKKELEDKRLFMYYSNQYSEFVLRVLNDLKEAIYPAENYSVSGPMNYRDRDRSWVNESDWRPCWEIGSQYEETSDISSHTYIVGTTLLQIIFEFDSKKNPVFLCQIDKSHKLYCPATEADLIRTLHKLYQ